MAENKGHENLKPIRDTERAKELGSKGGKAKKGSLHISTHIQNMLNDEDFTLWLSDPVNGAKEYKGAPIKAIITTAMIKAANNDAPAREWLARHGYGNTLNVNVDPREDILERFGLHAGETEEIEESPSS